MSFETFEESLTILVVFLLSLLPLLLLLLRLFLEHFVKLRAHLRKFCRLLGAFLLR